MGDWTRVDKGSWKDFFDSLSRQLEGTEVEVEVVGLDLGDQLELDRVPLLGLTYEAREDTLYIYVADMVHAIAKPKEIWLQAEAEGLSSLTVEDSEGRKQFIRMQRPLALPPGFRAAG